MSAPQFTSGPWLIHATNRVIVQADGAFADVTVKDGKVIGDDGAMPCSICLLRDPSEDFSEDETLANGFLIAAAPELYEALQRICAAFPDDAPALIEARRVLAKARGESDQ